MYMPKPKPKLSLALVVKNEETMLERCLESVAGVVDEIVITDTGSTDKTVQIASKYTNKVHYFEWIDDFSAAYNYCVSKTSSDFVMKWDADFVLSTESQSLLLALKEHNFERANHIYLRLQNIETATGKASGSALRELIFNKNDFYYASPVHMYLRQRRGSQNNEKICNDIVVNHYKDLHTKQYRLSQSYRIIQKSLEIDSNNAYLTYHMILGHLYSDEYKEALEKINYFLQKWPDYIPERVMTLLRKKFECLLKLGRVDEVGSVTDNFLFLKDYPQMILLQADIAALQNREEAIGLYAEYLTKNFLPVDTHYGYHYYRNIVHPRIMIARLISKDDPQRAKQYLLELADFKDCVSMSQDDIALIASELSIKL